MESKIHLIYIPFTGLGLYGGYRGKRWLKNRIEIFKQFVVPSLLNQTTQDFVLWVSWRREDRDNSLVAELEEFLKPKFRTIFTYNGVCFWDDKYPDNVARERLLTSLHDSIGNLFNIIGQEDYVYMTIQPSDDCYYKDAFALIQNILKVPEVQAVGFENGYMINYTTKELAEYNPETNPPFFTIKFPREIFLNPTRHAQYIGPYKSHEYVPNFLNYAKIHTRGFLVGTHGENISTVFNHPYKGKLVDKSILADFGIYDLPPLKLKLSLRKWFFKKLPHGMQRKLRYWFGEKLYNKFYEFIRS